LPKKCFEGVVWFKKTVVKANGKEYVYGQLIQSYRRESDGKPAHRVVAKMGRIDLELADNLQVAFRAYQDGNCVAIVEPDVLAPSIQPIAHYSFLDVAVLHQLWGRLGLDRLLCALDENNRKIPFGDMVFALAANRCLDPASKVEATRWYQRTALPELLGHAPKAFNNTRVHRTLDQLADVEDTLQKKLLQVIGRHHVTSGVFIDVTDTWFEGRGPSLAEFRKTKEGLWRLKIGIVLATTQDGLPLRWKVIAGRAGEQQALLQAAQWVREQSRGSEDQPFVVDRAMGNIKNIAQMKAAGIPYLTALRSHAIDRFLPDHPVFELADGIDATHPDARTQLETAAQTHGLTRIDKNNYGLVPGTIEPVLTQEQMPSVHIVRTQEALASAGTLQQLLDEGVTQKQAAQHLGLKPTKAHTLLGLLKLSPQIQEAIVAGNNTVSVSKLSNLAKMPLSEQLAEWKTLKDQQRNVTAADTPNAASNLAVFFHPARFIARRREIAEKHQFLDEQLDDLNRRLLSPNSRRTQASIQKEVSSQLLNPKDFQALFDVHITKSRVVAGCPRFQVHIEENDEWRKARCRDGFLVLAANPNLSADPLTFQRWYSAKNAIEAGFRNIKSHLKLRPVYVYTDPSVRAHVSICMLALLLRRSLELACQELTADSIFSLLSHVNLNELMITGQTKRTGLYTTTRPNSDQLAILKSLDMEQLTDVSRLPEVLTLR
jgi:hypothetical protein